MTMYNTKPYFKNICQIGDLFLQYVFISFEGDNLLFSCTDKSSAVYLCLCYETRGRHEWLIARTNYAILRAMVQKSITLCAALRGFDQEKFILKSAGQDYQSNSLQYAEIDALTLPAPDVYVEYLNYQPEFYLRSFDLENITYQIVLSEQISIPEAHTASEAQRTAERQMCSSLSSTFVFAA